MIGSTLERSICSWIVSLLRPQSPSPQTAHEPRKQDRLPGRPSYCLAATQPPDGERPALPGQRQWQRQEQNIFCFPIEGRTLDPGTISTLCLTDLAPRPHGRPIFMLSVQLALIARPGRSPPRRVALVPLYDAILSPVASWGPVWLPHGMIARLSYGTRCGIPPVRIHRVGREISPAWPGERGEFCSPLGSKMDGQNAPSSLDKLGCPKVCASSLLSWVCEALCRTCISPSTSLLPTSPTPPTRHPPVCPVPTGSDWPGLLSSAPGAGAQSSHAGRHP